MSTRVVVLMHWREQKLTTNTAALACLALPNSEIRIRGGREKPLEAGELVRPGQSAVLLYPSDDAVELDAASLRNLPRPLTIVVPDGSWRQARKVATREKALLSLPRVKLPPGERSEFRLRHSPHEENLSTFEAIARAMGILERPEIQSGMEALFMKFIERTLWSRGKLLADECTTGIPEAAFIAAREAGIAGGAKPRGLRT
ncbi:MAG: tRNA-uridine aminocarboxypropyltransferase [Bdellovibrionota bacterium]